MSELRTQTRRQRVEAKEQAIIAAAREIFQEHGFEKTKIAEIAKLAGVAEGTVYLYFENKNALILAVASEFYDRLTRDAANGIKDLNDTVARLEFLARHHFERVAQEWMLLAQAINPFKAVSDYRETEAYQLNRTYVEVFDQVIRDGINRGDIRDDISLSVMRDVFYGGIEYGTRTMRLRSTKADIDAIVGDFMKVFAAGMFVASSTAVPKERRSLDQIANRLEKIAGRLEAVDKK
jgi:AcrR family transcriptional regulator